MSACLCGEKIRCKGLCRTCYARELRRKNAHKAREYDLQWRRNNPKRRLLSRAKYRAKRDGLAFELSESDITLPEVCQLCSRKLEYSLSRQDRRCASIDKIDPSLGYTKKNTWVICCGCNQKKGALTPEFMHMILSEIERRSIIFDEAGTAIYTL